MKNIVFFWALVAFSCNAFALTYNEFKEQLSGSGNAVPKIYIMGVGNGIMASNSYRTHAEGIDPLFCLPSKLELNADNMISILDNFVTQDERYPNQDVDALLIFALIDTFPCD